MSDNSLSLNREARKIVHEKKEEIQIEASLKKRVLLFCRIGRFLAFSGVVVLLIIGILYFWDRIVRFFLLSYIDFLYLLLFSGIVVSALIFGGYLISYLSCEYSIFIESNTDLQKRSTDAIKGMLYSFPILMLLIILSYLLLWCEMYRYVSLHSNLSLDEYIWYSLSGWILALLLISWLFWTIVNDLKEEEGEDQ